MTLTETILIWLWNIIKIILKNFLSTLRRPSTQFPPYDLNVGFSAVVSDLACKYWYMSALLCCKHMDYSILNKRLSQYLQLVTVHILVMFLHFWKYNLEKYVHFKKQKHLFWNPNLCSFKYIIESWK